MSLYLDSSALVKRYVSEPDSSAAAAILQTDPIWITAEHAYVEVRIALAKRLAGDPLKVAERDLEDDLDRMIVVALDGAVCRRAADLGIRLRVRSLDALHLAAAERAGGRALTVVTFDLRFADACRALGFPVLGV